MKIKVADNVAEPCSTPFPEVQYAQLAVFGIPPQRTEVLLRPVQMQRRGLPPRRLYQTDRRILSNRDRLPMAQERQTLRDGQNQTREKDDRILNDDTFSIRVSLRDIRNVAEAEFICKELKRQGLLKTYVVAGSRQDEDFAAFLQTFWNYDISPYVKEKLRKNHGIHRNYTKGQKLSVEKYWAPFFTGRVLGDITRQDIDKFINDLASRELSAGRRNIILKAGTIPLRWAFSKEFIEKDITTGIIWFSGKAAERQILSPEMAQAIFQIEWEDMRAKLANMLAAVTGLRAGEIQGLRLQDLGKDRIYIRHSWNFRDKLKTTKNNESREVELPFPSLVESLFSLAKSNPHGADADSYIFWTGRSASKPMEAKFFAEGLRAALMKAGMSKESAEGYVFHGWRHFFTTYMISRLEKKLLKSQTGHKTDSMLYRYGDHWAEGDREKIRQAQMDVFGALVPAAKS